MQNSWETPPQPAVAAAAQPGAMPGPAPGISVIGGVKFAFESPDWKTNLLFAMVLSLIPIAGPLALSGWMAETHQRLVRRHPQPMPKFDFGDFVHYLGRGVPVFLVGLVAALPIGIGFGVVIVAAALAGVLAGAGTQVDSLVMIAVWIAAGFCSLVCWLVMSVLLNAAQTRAELTEDFGQALNLGKVWAYARATWATVLVKNLIFALVAFGILVIGMLLCYIGLYPAIAVIQMAAAHLRWQIYEHYLREGGEPIALKPPQWLPSDAQRYQRGY
ncbi:MAG TPA: DUF4013 domain-containing protein [Polyangiaceae bacterium]